MSRRPVPHRLAEPTRELAVGQEFLLERQLRWLIGVRLVAVSSVAVPYLLLGLGVDRELSFDFLIQWIGLAYLSSLVYITLWRSARLRPQTQAYLQFGGDLILISGLVFYFNGVVTPFSILYLIIIALASVMFGRREGFLVATAAFALYAPLCLALYRGWIVSPTQVEELEIAWTRFAYNLGINFVGFYAVALLTSHLRSRAEQAETALQEKRVDLADLRVAYRDVIESIPSGLLTTDVRGILTSANLTARGILGKETDEILGRPIHEIGLFDESTWQGLCRSTQRIDKARQEFDYSVAGRTLRIGYSVSALTSADGTLTGYIFIFQDLSDWHKLQEEVKVKDRMAAVGELASGLAHEVGNPLAAISGSVQMLASSLPARAAAQRKLLTIVLKESERLERTIKNFLKFARPKSHSSAPFDIGGLLRENVALLRNSAELGPGHRVELDVEPENVTLIGDADQISQIFWNLSRNALRAMEGPGTLTIRGRTAGGVYRLEFTDTGRGMDEIERANMFHPFRSRFDGGTGIGMAIVYRIVQQHEGRLTVESAPEKGTSIIVELPAAESVPAAMEA